MFGHIHTPLLKLFSVQFGLNGIQVTPITLHRPASVLILLWNILYSFAAFWGVLKLNLVDSDSVITGCASNSRTLFGFLIEHSQKYSAYVNLIQMAYFLVYGRKLVAVFDSEQFRQVYHNKRKAVIIFSVFFALNHLFLVVALLETARWDIWVKRRPWDRFSASIGFYSMFTYTFWLYNLMHYSQFGINRCLRCLEKRLAKRKISSRKTLAQLQSLALVSKQINSLLSFPFILYTSMTVFLLILAGSTSIICIPRAQELLFSVVNVAYLLYLISLNQGSGQLLGRLFATIHQRMDVKEKAIIAQQEANGSGAEARKHLLLKRRFLSRQRCLRCHLQGRLQAVTSRRVELTECEALYSAYVDIRIFQMSALNSRTLWQVLLFLISYVVFFAQTVDSMEKQTAGQR